MKNEIVHHVDARTKVVCESDNTSAKSVGLDELETSHESATTMVDSLLGETVGDTAFERSQASLDNEHASGEIIEQVLRKSAYSSVRSIRARIERNVVVLHGKVPSFYLRQLALATAMKYLPGRFIVDFIEVESA